MKTLNDEASVNELLLIQKNILLERKECNIGPIIVSFYGNDKYIDFKAYLNQIENLAKKFDFKEVYTCNIDDDKTDFINNNYFVNQIPFTIFYYKYDSRTRVIKGTFSDDFFEKAYKKLIDN